MLDWFMDTPIVRAIKKITEKEVVIQNLPEYKKKALKKQEIARKKRKKKQKHKKALKRKKR